MFSHVFSDTLFIAPFLAGCTSVHEPVPQGHVGPVAHVEDSFKQQSSPILPLTRAVHEVKGTLDFTLEPNKRCVVRGSLQADRSAVWLEEQGSQQVVGKKIEVEGSAKLGSFDK